MELFALALSQAVDVIERERHKGSIKWGQLHQMHYPHSIFGNTPLRSLFDKRVPAHGTEFTINMGMTTNNPFETHKFDAIISANLKMISELGIQTYYSIDTGESENFMSPNYFNMNERHLNQQLHKLLDK